MTERESKCAFVCRLGGGGTDVVLTQLPLRDALQAAWDDAWNLVHDRRQPSMDEAAELETRFQDLLDEFDRRTR